MQERTGRARETREGRGNVITGSYSINFVITEAKNVVHFCGILLYIYKGFFYAFLPEICYIEARYAGVSFHRVSLFQDFVI